eukprot:gene7853-9968_t
MRTAPTLSKKPCISTTALSSSTICCNDFAYSQQLPPASNYRPSSFIRTMELRRPASQYLQRQTANSLTHSASTQPPRCYMSPVHQYNTYRTVWMWAYTIYMTSSYWPISRPVIRSAQHNGVDAICSTERVVLYTVCHDTIRLRLLLGSQMS